MATPRKPAKKAAATKPAPRRTTRTAAPKPADETPKVEAAAQAAADVMEDITDAGHFGESTDPTPNENYTVGGVTSGKPTPETDPDAARDVGSTRFEGTSR